MLLWPVRLTLCAVREQAHPLRVNPRLRVLKTVYKANIDIVHIQRDEASQLFSLSAARESAAAAASVSATASMRDTGTGGTQRNSHPEDLFQVRRCLSLLASAHWQCAVHRPGQAITHPELKSKGGNPRCDWNLKSGCDVPPGGVLAPGTGRGNNGRCPGTALRGRGAPCADGGAPTRARHPGLETLKALTQRP